MKKIFSWVIILGIIGGACAVYLWNKPHKKAEDETAIVISAKQLCASYAQSEDSANRQYLNKVLEVSGEVGEVNTNQDGGKMVVLKTDDPILGVQCTMRDKIQTPEKGKNVVIRGFCSGNDITGVLLTDCILK